MSRYNTKTAVGIRTPNVASGGASAGAIKTKAKRQVVTNHQGGIGFRRGTKSELFLSAATSFVQPKFYESESELRVRQTKLLHKVAVDDPEWLYNFLTWLRVGGNLRTGSLVLAADAVAYRLKKRADNRGGWNRKIIATVLQRADEPGEMLAYWRATHGQRIPQPVKRGVADAASRMYTERNWLKYDSKSAAYRFADVIELTHPEIRKPELAALILDEAHGYPWDYADATAGGLEMIATNKFMRLGGDGDNGVDGSKLNADLLARAGMTWEAVPSIVDGGWTADLWEAMIPNMGVMALTRNLNNFDKYGVGKSGYQKVVDRLTDPELVRKSRILPIRAITAYRNATADRWKYPLAEMLEATLENVPALPGRTLVLVDVSGSMHWSNVSSGCSYADAAAVFGAALAKRGEDTDLYAYDTSLYPIEYRDGESTLQVTDRITRTGGGGTRTHEALRAAYDGHDRVVLLTDEMSSSARGAGGSIPNNVPLITFNLAGYAAAGVESSPTRITLSGLSDSAWGLLDMWGNASDKWPWEQ